MEQVDTNDFESISPYTDEEAVKAFEQLAKHPMCAEVSRYMFPDEDENFLHNVLLNVRSVDEFQRAVMSKFVEFVIDKTIRNFSYDGVENFKKINGKFLAISNHRDIILDPAITQLILYHNDIDRTQIAVGDNLLKSKTIEHLIRSNRMIRVIRGISARELYLCSIRLSNYIRNSITSGKSSVWIAQRQGRTKDGIDTTEQGLLKMFDMSGKGDFVSNFMELNMVPLSISYEYEPCDIEKAREILVSRSEKYVKAENEDLQSIMSGLKRWKGDVHIHIGKPLTEEEIRVASFCDKNDRYQAIRHAVDKRVIEGYRLSKTNYMGYDMANHSYKYADQYTAEDMEAFTAYIEHQLDKVEKSLNRNELRDILIRIYGNPVAMKESIYFL